MPQIIFLYKPLAGIDVGMHRGWIYQAWDEMGKQSENIFSSAQSNVRITVVNEMQDP